MYALYKIFTLLLLSLNLCYAEELRLRLIHAGSEKQSLYYHLNQHRLNPKGSPPHQISSALLLKAKDHQLQVHNDSKKLLQLSLTRTEDRDVTCIFYHLPPDLNATETEAQLQYFRLRYDADTVPQAYLIQLIEPNGLNLKIATSTLHLPYQKVVKIPLTNLHSPLKIEALRPFHLEELNGERLTIILYLNPNGNLALLHFSR